MAKKVLALSFVLIIVALFAAPQAYADTAPGVTFEYYLDGDLVDSEFISTDDAASRSEVDGVIADYEESADLYSGFSSSFYLQRTDVVVDSAGNFVVAYHFYTFKHIARCKITIIVICLIALSTICLLCARDEY